MNGEEVLDFANLWLWLIFVGIGLVFILLELIVGIDTGLDLVLIGTAFLIGGLVSWPFKLWIVTLLVTVIICVVYVLVGRKYIHSRLAVKPVKMNVDLVIGQRGVVLKDIKRNTPGRVRVGNENWRARAEEDIREGTEVLVSEISGATLIVEKSEGGDQI